MLTLACAVPTQVENSFAIPERFPVGAEAEPFFREEGAKLVRNGLWGLGCTDPDGANYALVDMFSRNFTLTESGEWTEEQILSFSRQFAGKHFAGESVSDGFGFKINLKLPEFFAEHSNGDYRFFMSWWYNGAEIFTYDSGRFQLEKGPQGLRPPAWVLERMKLCFTKNVFARFPGVQKARMRWMEIDEAGHPFFTDIPYPFVAAPFHPENTGKKELPPTSYPTVIVDPETGLLVLPAAPVLQKLQGVLTLVFTNGLIARYDLRTGERFRGPQGAQEPPFLTLKVTPGVSTDRVENWGGWAWVGDRNGRYVWNGWAIVERTWIGPEVSLQAYAVLVNPPPLTFERSNDLQTWQTLEPTHALQLELSLRTVPLAASPNFAIARWARKRAQPNAPPSINFTAQEQTLLDLEWAAGLHREVPEGPPVAVDEPSAPSWWNNTRQNPTREFYRVRYAQ